MCADSGDAHGGFPSQLRRLGSVSCSVRRVRDFGTRSKCWRDSKDGAVGVSMGRAHNGFDSFETMGAACPYRTFTAGSRNVTGAELNLPASWTTATRADGTSTARSPARGVAPQPMRCAGVSRNTAGMTPFLRAGLAGRACLTCMRCMTCATGLVSPMRRTATMVNTATTVRRWGVPLGGADVDAGASTSRSVKVRVRGRRWDEPAGPEGRGASPAAAPDAVRRGGVRVGGGWAEPRRARHGRAQVDAEAGGGGR
ncbi:hypothetical protein STAFG_3933 [Streptomyces afghaniensis 772]|uniref:Uncharacterized protein n=1 Tax=Streptomyces afghaniensis 772 TaxID=1283301 RepID=S4MQS0_9ACTN|nr:hypothetical protein STAFG_3933 [Streptomyces afghaniensis 772]